MDCDTWSGAGSVDGLAAEPLTHVAYLEVGCYGWALMAITSSSSGPSSQLPGWHHEKIASLGLLSTTTLPSIPSWTVPLKL